MKKRVIIILVMCSVFLLNACSREYNTELMNASKGGDIIAIKNVLKRGANVNEQSNKGKTALMFAASEGHINAARTLIENGAKVDIADHYGTTALIVASTSGNDEIVDLLLEQNANINVRDESGSSPLVNAVYFGHTKTVKVLFAFQNLDGHQKLDKQDGEELLLLASGLGHNDIISVMIDSGISVNARGLKQRTALMAAAAFDRPEIVKILLAKGANPDAKDEDGNTAFDVANDRGSDEVLALLNATPGKRH
jgi:ankyrin repeat protein